jgi:uncharacterized protein DUF3768
MTSKHCIAKKTGRRAKVIDLNDQLRTTLKGGRVQMTRSVYDLDDRLRGRALAVMARYNKFDPDGEHDRGVFIFAGYAFEWRIEYRRADGTGVSPDASDPEQTLRVLTLYVFDDVLA